MALKSMKLTAEEAEREASVEGPYEDQPQYPYGLGICLDDDALAKLSPIGIPQPGGEMILNARVVVTGVSIRQREGREDCRDVDLQITAMELVPVLSVGSRIYKDED